MSSADRSLRTLPEALVHPGNGHAHGATPAAAVQAAAHAAAQWIAPPAVQRFAATLAHAAEVQQHVFSLYVSNKPGVLVRVALVFARRGCNIDGLVVSEAHDPAFSHMTVTVSGSENTLRLILGQLDKLVDVIHVEAHSGEDHVHTGDPLIARGEETTC